MFYDIERHRIASENRIGANGDPDKRAKRNIAVAPDLYLPHIATLKAAEHACELALVRSYRRTASPAVRTWQTASKGVGDKLFARFLGHLGHPLIATPHRWEGTGTERVLIEGEPYERTLRQLWAYCGHGDPARKRRAGQNADDGAAGGNPRCKMLIHLIAAGCVKEPGRQVAMLRIGEQKPDECTWDYRAVYEQARLDFWAEPRDGWTDLHQHNAAIRKVAKEILRDLWIVARGDR